MECIIDVDIDTYGAPEFINQKIIKARKEHKCSECHAIIPVNDDYELVRGKWDGEWERFKTCKVCLEIRNELFCSYYLGSIFEDLKNSDFEIDMAVLMNFSSAAQRKLIEKLIIDSLYFDKDKSVLRGQTYSYY